MLTLPGKNIPAKTAKRKRTTKTKKRVLAISTAPFLTPEKPKIPATIAITKKTAAKYNNILSP